MARVLYISYDGLLEPLGQSQVLQYVRGLAAEHEIFLLTYEKAADLAETTRVRTQGDELRAAGVHWRRLTYHKRPSLLATAFDIACGLVVGLWICLREKVEVVHARSYVAGVVGWSLKRATGPRFIFDMRGLWPDQRVDDGFWRRESLAYRLAKWFERRFFTDADAVVSLTHAAVDLIRAFPYLKDRSPRFVVIPTCTNLRLFSLQAPVSVDGEFRLGFIGSSQLYLFDEVLAFFSALLKERPGARLRLLTRDEPAALRERAVSAGIPAEAVSVRSVPFGEMPEEMSRMDAAAFFLEPTAARQAISPTKLGELLACGVPCVVNAGVGDFDRIISSSGAGVVMSGFSDHDRASAVGRLLTLAADPASRARCAAVAEKHFRLEDGIAAYSALYRSLEVP